MRGIILAVVLAAVSTQNPAQDPAQDGAERPLSPQAAHVAAHAQPAVEYLVSLFEAHDVVVVGEIHEVADNEIFVAGLLDDLYHRAGVRVYASEFVPRRHSVAINLLVQADEWDEAAAIDLMRRGPNPLWGYREYLEIIKAAWEVNRRRPPSDEPLRIAGLDSDWNQLALLNEKDEAKNFRIRMDREKCMIEAVEEAMATPGAKVLAHVGFAHSITKHGERFATVLKRRHGERLFQVALHHNFPGPGERSPFTARLEEIFAGCAAPVGVTIKGSPLAEMRSDDCMYFTMLGRGSSLDDAAEGYVYLAPVAVLKPVSWIDGFVTDETFVEAKEIARRMNRLGEDEDSPDAAALNEAMRRHFERRKDR